MPTIFADHHHQPRIRDRRVAFATDILAGEPHFTGCRFYPPNHVIHPRCEDVFCEKTGTALRFRQQRPEGADQTFLGGQLTGLDDRLLAPFQLDIVHGGKCLVEQDGVLEIDSFRC